MKRAVPIALALAVWVGAAHAQGDPDAFDPILDGAPASGGEARVPVVERGAPGMWVSTHAGLYLGAVQSYLTTQRSTLRQAGRVAFGFGVGGRTPSLIGLGVDLDLGLGQTYEPELDDTVFAFDLLIEPRVVAHFAEGETFGAYAGIGALAAMFDLELSGINQAGVGPSLVAGIGWRSGQHGELYLEGSACAFYDLLAYRYRAPTEDELEADPGRGPVRVDGEWYGVFRLTVGYRLLAL